MNCLAPIVRRDVLKNVSLSLLVDILVEDQIYVDDLVAVAEYEHDFSVIVQNSKRRFPSEMMRVYCDFLSAKLYFHLRVDPHRSSLCPVVREFSYLDNVLSPL